MDVFSYQCENHIKKSSPHSIANIEGFHYFHPQKMKLGFLIKPFFYMEIQNIWIWKYFLLDSSCVKIVTELGTFIID